MGQKYEAIYMELKISTDQNKKDLLEIKQEYAKMEAKSKNDANERIKNHNFSRENFTNNDLNDINNTIRMNTNYIHEITTKFSTVLNHMNKIKEFEEIVNYQKTQIQQIHKELKNSTNKLIPGSADYIKKNKNPDPSNFVDTTSYTGKPK
tara:strand:- start:312 stop:761 length:450 start_codon:yes stop_codon:yes gene_type:complete